MITFTTYGVSVADDLGDQPSGIGGASAHLAACQKDTGMTILLTGKDYKGRRFTKTAKSVSGAFFMAHAAWGIRNA